MTLCEPARLAPGGLLLERKRCAAEFASARLDMDARNPQLHAGSSIPIAMLVAVTIVAIAVDPFAHHLVAVALVEAARSAEVPAANFFAHPGIGSVMRIARPHRASRPRRHSPVQ